ncbi:MAG: hypothetical protein K2M42_12190 [Oscillospiraceae bacterium]|nr:hypothetical protein [Oscillospiraceae bacterium]
MSEISFNSIFDGVSRALHAAFPPPTQIYGDEVKQDLKPGDFNVVMSGAGHKQEVGRRYKRTPTIDVIYYPREDNAECYDIADQLTAVLESITTPEGDVVHATSCTWAVTDGVLHVLLTYDHFVYRPREEVMMGELKIDQKG